MSTAPDINERIVSFPPTDIGRLVIELNRSLREQINEEVEVICKDQQTIKKEIKNDIEKTEQRLDKRIESVQKSVDLILKEIKEVNKENEKRIQVLETEQAKIKSYTSIAGKVWIPLFVLFLGTIIGALLKLIIVSS